MSDKPENRTKEFEKELRELILRGVLVNQRDNGTDKLYGAFRKKIAKNEVLPEFLESKEKFAEKVADLVWDKDALALLQKFVRSGVADLSPVYKQLSHVPKAMIDAKAKNIKGVTPGGKQKHSTLFEAGIGRIATTAEVENIQKKGAVVLQNFTITNPFKLPAKSKDNFRYLIINGPHLGLEYNRVLDENVLRNLFRHAKRIGVDAIIITAGLMWMDMKKSSGRLTTHRALYSGLDFDADVLDPEYRAEAVEIRKNLPPDRISFATRRERVINALGGYKKVTEHKNGSPLAADIPVFIIFGYTEEEMIETAVHEHLRHLKTCIELDARTARKAVEAELEYALAQSRGRETKETKGLRAKAYRLLRLEKRKSANTNIDPLEHKRFVPIIRSLLISWYKKAIPNSEFIGQGTVVCEAGGRKIEISQATVERPTEADISSLIKSVGQRDLDGTLPDVILGAGAYNLNARWSARECMRGIESDQVQVWQLPVFVDRDYVRGAKSELIKRGSPIEELISDGDFEPGAFVLSMTDGVWDSHPLPVSMFTQRFPKTSVASSAPPKEILVYVEGDQHTDNPAKEYVWDARTQKMLPMEVAASEIFMREFIEKGKSLPFHVFSSHGDSTQGHHFPTEQNRHPQHESMGALESDSAELIRRIDAKDVSSEELRVSAKKMLMRLNRQIRLRGEHWYQQQIEDFTEHSVEHRRRFFLEILKTGASANVKLRGIAQVLSGNDNAQDRRDLGRVNILDGNHGQKTTEGTFAEAWLFARVLLLSVLAEDDCPFTRDELRRLVRAPIFGNVASGYGLVSAGGGYEWGLHLRHDPTRKSGQDGDPLAGATRNLAERGDYGFIFNGHEFIAIVGDQHRYAAAFGPHKAVFNNACGTHGDAYGDDWGFSKANLGGMIVCVPVDGPGAGPVRMIPISHVFIRRYMEKPWPINWARLFPNPA